MSLLTIRVNLRRVELMLDLIMPIAMVLFFLPPALSWYAPTVVSIASLIQKGLFIVCFWYFIRFRIFTNKSVYLILGYLVWLLAVTVLRGDSLPSVGGYMNVFCICVISIYCLQRNPEKYIRWMALIFTALLFLNALFWQPGGMYVNANGQASFMLGTKTSLTEYQIPACCFVALLFYLRPSKKRLLPKILAVILIVSLLYWNLNQPISASIMCLAVFVGLMIVMPMKSRLVKKGFQWGFWIVNAINVAIVFFNAQVFFRGFITNVLHESADLNARVPIWQIVILRISESPIWGHGVNSNIFFAPTAGMEGVNQAAHNGLLNFLFIGGIIGTVIMFVACAVALKKANASTKIGRIICISLICFACLWIAEQIKYYETLFSVLLVAYFMEDSVKEPTLVLQSHEKR